MTPSITDIIAAASFEAATTPRWLLSATDLWACRWRHRAMFLCRRLRPDVSFPALGLRFNRDHSTVLGAAGKISLLLDRGDEDEIEAVGRICARLGFAAIPTDAAAMAKHSKMVRRQRLLRGVSMHLAEAVAMLDELAALDHPEDADAQAA